MAHFFHVTFAARAVFAECDASALAGAAVSVPASTTVAPHSTAALLLMESLRTVRGVRPACHTGRAASFRKSTPCTYIFDQDLTESSPPIRPNPFKREAFGPSVTRRPSRRTGQGLQGVVRNPRGAEGDLWPPPALSQPCRRRTGSPSWSSEARTGQTRRCHRVPGSACGTCSTRNSDLRHGQAAERRGPRQVRWRSGPPRG